ncbi:FGLLP motif-containing membrane protein [Actinomadura formosensis]|uniref:FGLLP motif-containing membrane protein n=1 Tax=Actinomadura formosensis TaxID=60706 RepID=UPI003D8A6233
MLLLSAHGSAFAAHGTAGTAAEPRLRAYAVLGATAGSGDPGADVIEMSVTGATACRWPAGSPPPAPERGGDGVRVLVNGTVLWPSADLTESSGVQVARAGAEELLLFMPVGQTPEGEPFTVLVECRSPSLGTWSKVIEQMVSYPSFENLLPLMQTGTPSGGTVEFSDVNTLYQQTPRVTAEQVTAMVDGRAAQVVAGDQAGIMSVRMPPGVGPGIRLVRLTAGGRTRIVPISNGFAPMAPASPPPKQPSGPTFSKSIPALSQLPIDPVGVGIAASVALALVLLIGFPSGIFNKTLEEHRDELARGLSRLAAPLRWARTRPGRGGYRSGSSGRWTWPRFAVFCAVAALLLVFLDPGIGWASTDALVLWIGFLIAIPLTTLAYSGTVEIYARLFSGVRGTIFTVGWALGVALICMLVSRFAHFKPGYVYGLVAGFAVLETDPGGADRRRSPYDTEGESERDEEPSVRELTVERDGGTVLAGAVAVLAVSLLAYVLLSQIHVRALESGAPVPLRLWDSILATVFVTGVQVVVFGLMPLRFMDGVKLYSWSKRIWAAVYGPSVAMFFYVLVFNHDKEGAQEGNRNAAYWKDVPTGFALFLVFGAISFLFWGYFRFRPEREQEGAGGEQARTVYGIRRWTAFVGCVALPTAVVIAAALWAGAHFARGGPLVAAASPRGTAPKPAVPATGLATASPRRTTCEPGPTVTDHLRRTFTAWKCPIKNRPGNVYAEPGVSQVIGRLGAGPNWFVCLRKGDRAPGETWLYTQADEIFENRGWGWFPASYLSETGEDVTMVSIPECRMN